MRPKNFDRQVPLRVDKQTYAALRRMQKGRRATIASLIRDALDDALYGKAELEATLETAAKIDPSYKFATMFLTTTEQLERIETIADEAYVSRNTLIVAALRRFVEQRKAVAA